MSTCLVVFSPGQVLLSIQQMLTVEWTKSWQRNINKKKQTKIESTNEGYSEVPIKNNYFELEHSTNGN